MLYITLLSTQNEKQALLHTGVKQSAISESELKRILSKNPKTFIIKMPAPDFRVQEAIGNMEPVRKRVLVGLLIAGKFFGETFMIFRTMENVLIRMTFFKHNSVTLVIRNYHTFFYESYLPFNEANGK